MKLGVVLSMFPEAHETFILRELLELDRQGVDFEIASLQFPRGEVRHPEIQRLVAKTHYVRLWGWSALSAFLGTLMRRPLRLLRVIAILCAKSWRDPVELFKSLAILPAALHFGRVFRAHGVTHLHGHWRNVPTTACWILSLVEDWPWSAAIHGENIFSPNPLLARKLADAKFVVTCNAYSCRHLREQMGLPHPERVHLNYHGLDEQAWRAAEAPPPVGRGSGGGERPLPATTSSPLSRENDAENRTSSGILPDPLPEGEGTRVILTVARLVDFKGYDDLLPAVAELVREGRDLEHRIVGVGPDEAKLRALAASLGIADRVRFLGLLPLEGVFEELRRADVFALASVIVPGGNFDGVPNVLAEAMAFGTPVVSTAVSGIPELVETEVSGLLVPERNPSALAAALRRVLDDKELASRLVVAGKIRVRERFDLARNVAELKELLLRYADPSSQNE